MSAVRYRGPDVIAVGRPSHVSTDAAVAEIEALPEDGRISDPCAVTVASWWASPGMTGRAFAALSTTGAVGLEDLTGDITGALDGLAVCVPGRGGASATGDFLALLHLARWAVNHPTRH